MRQPESSSCRTRARQRSQRFIDNFSQAFLIVRRHGNLLAIHIDDGSPVDPEGFAAVLVGGNPPGYFLALHVRLEAIEVEAQLGGVVIKVRADVFRRHPGISISVKRVMHFPEAAL